MFKGTTKIELTNVKTGAKEIYQHENMVTNAVNDVLGMNPMGFKGMLADHSMLFPVVPKLIGGIMLCEKQLEENPEKYWVPNDNPIVGYSGFSVSDGADPKRGSLNQLESGELEDGSGYRFVFDFATSQGNGVISALGLTSDAGGSNGYGNLVTSKNGIQEYYSHSTDEDDYPLGITAFQECGTNMANIVTLRPEKNEAVAIWKSAAKTYNIRKSYLPLTSIGLFDSPKLFPYDYRFTDRTVYTSTFGVSDTYYSFVRGDDGYIWGFEHSDGAYGNDSGSASVNWVKINLDDFSIEEGTWSLDAQLMPFGVYNPPGTSRSVKNHCIVHGGFLYCFSYDRKGIYKIELKNITNIVFMEYPDGTIDMTPAWNSSNDWCYTAFNVMYDTVYFTNGYIEGNSIVCTKKYAYSSSGGTQFSSQPAGILRTAKPGLRVGPFLLMGGMWLYLSDQHNAFSVALLSNYLATINNLMEPVEKTAEKTMKITYILRMIPEVIPEEETE